ncbi:hypothetical protein Q9966_015414 [Columba livia]|nr:hypothetical protein Q9966_015414 [Columba livia]
MGFGGGWGSPPWLGCSGCWWGQDRARGARALLRNKRTEETAGALAGRIGAIRMCMGLYRRVWGYTDVHGSVQMYRGYTDVYGAIQTCMGLYRRVWVCPDV